MNRPALIGIINLTPDSFSGDGRSGYAALSHAAEQVAAGADILDIGAESTRPGAAVISAEEEWERLGPFLDQVMEQEWRPQVRLSVDTRHAQTARRVLAMGVEIVNDVSGLSSHAMRELLGEYDCDCVVMHALSLPADPGIVWDAHIDPVKEILTWKEQMLQQARKAGIAEERLIFDPGIGFGKMPAHSLKLMIEAKQLVESGGRWLYGHSRKSFMTLFTDAPARERDAVTLAFSAQLAEARVPYLRVHNVAAHQQMFAKLCP